MGDADSKLVENRLAEPDIHREWRSRYRTQDNEAFFTQAFDLVVDTVKPLTGATFLDAGCGSCAHSVRLAQRGFNVEAVDFSESALKMAEEYVEANALEDRIKIHRESLLALSFPNASFDYVLCWGVLMHIPDVERAVAELARVLKPGGFLIVSEGNMRSLEAVGMRAVKRVLRREKAEVKKTEAGMEYWVTRVDGALVTRQANVAWLVQRFEQHGLTLVKRVAGQFSEAYRMFSAPSLKRVIHSLNSFWFRRVRLPGFAYGNILFLRKA